MKRVEMMERTRAGLLAAARKTFAQYGYAAASMDQLTADAGLTRGALYHHFGDKRGLLAAVIEQIDGEAAERLQAAANPTADPWVALIDGGVAYIELALDPEFQRIVLLDGPAVLGDPSRWPSQNACRAATTHAIQALSDQGRIGPIDAEAAARLLDGAAMDAALWIAASDEPDKVAVRATAAFRRMASGLLNG